MRFGHELGSINIWEPLSPCPDSGDVEGDRLYRGLDPLVKIEHDHVSAEKIVEV